MKMAVTGKIGSGKSFIAQEIARQAGVPYISVDAIVADCYSQPPFLRMAKSLTGETQKAKISDKLFAHPELLNAWIAHSSAYLFKAIEEKKASSSSFVMEYPLLLESGAFPSFDFVVYVDAPSELRFQRAALRDSASLEKIRQVDAQQASDEIKRLFSDYVILNDKDGVVPAQIPLVASLFSYPVPSRGSLLFKQHAQPHRAWHNLCHLSHSWKALNTLAAEALTDPFAYAVLLEANQFHDAVYDPQRSDNEINSLYLYRDNQTSLTYKHTAYVAQLIHATINHTLPSSFLADSFGKKVGELFLDSDLAIFAESPELVDFYDEAIRQEYAHVSDQLYYSARTSVLAKFNAKRIFMSEAFSALEEKAHQNLSQLIQKNSEKATAILAKCNKVGYTTGTVSE